ncbi:Ubiquinone biosynthesis protein coq9, mitochondrial [Ophiocordyceps camponoti-floridani]|uniref:Ubiquinone biosynthesis protein n=1 Tax=Ophiocordyceps camponoti-floridani TaxID=2030778 RepID=A0A8H4Q7T8_9HYPO|nr:Ubiquinone biosynthesis protein coq9, mitochondrial [Ophiocordyceps camponoti-floridani]
MPPSATRVMSLRSIPSLRLAQKLALGHRPRRFHSYQHATPDNGSFNPVEDAILAASYSHVPEHGFSQRALRLGARDAGYLDISPAAFLNGPFSLIRYHLVTQRKALSSRSRTLFAHDQQPPPVATAVAELTWARLMGNEAVIHQWQEALATMAQPAWLPASLKELALLSDEIWFFSGDKAVDFSWYSKRASLSVIYSTAELFMTNDKSPGFSETREFLERRLGEAGAADKAVASLGQWMGFTMNAGINILRSKGIRL